MNTGPLFKTSTFLWALAAISQIHRRPFSPNLVLQQFPPPYNAAALAQAATSLELRAAMRDINAVLVPALPTPFLAVLAPDPTAEAPRPHRLVLVIKCDASRALYLTENSAAPSTLEMDAFARESPASVMLCAPEVP